MKTRLIRVTIAALWLMGGAGAVAAPRTAGADKTAVPAAEIPNAWPKRTPQEQTETVAEITKFAEETAAKMDLPLKIYETKYFIFSSNIPQKEAKNWAGLLDRMYARLAEIFAVPKGENIWRGKAMVFVFTRKSDYQRYEQEINNTDPGPSDGMCHSFPNGLVTIAFYRQPDELVFAHVLVHESVHGFIHRYRSPARVPSWANEGLAETIATELVPQPTRGISTMKDFARREIQLHNNQLGGFFSLEHIEPWQYPVAETMCTYMITQAKRNYVDFINGIKEGLTPEESLAKRFKAGQDRLVPKFGEWLGLKRLRE
ncbi:MAG TPA: hypothetical protein VG326_10370 [Tepidisphaeraceae bacterium]|jgi:hypothetical protein|nr:hypothetical protein [Tepidisphaeraceae bacterium]